MGLGRNDSSLQRQSTLWVYHGLISTPEAFHRYASLRGAGCFMYLERRTIQRSRIGLTTLALAADPAMFGPAQ